MKKTYLEPHSKVIEFVNSDLICSSLLQSGQLDDMYEDPIYSEEFNI